MRIELLHVPHCPHVEEARRLLSSCLSELAIEDQVMEKEGPYPSPSILIDGEDVMGAPAVKEASCRLDLPTRERVIATLRERLSS